MNWAKVLVGAVLGGITGTIAEGVKIAVSGYVPERFRRWFVIGGDAAIAGLMIYNAMRTEDDFWFGVSVGVATTSAIALLIESRDLWRKIALLSQVPP